MHLSWSYTAEAALASPLEEIREQEEMNVRAEGQVAAVEEEEEEEDSSLNLSADISLDSGRAGTASPSQDAEILGSGMAGDGPSCDQSTDAEYVLLYSKVNFIQI